MQTGAGSKADNKSDADTTIQELKDSSAQLCKERGWDKYNTPRNLAISIAVEAAELLEHFQWQDGDHAVNKREVAAELADVLNYCVQFADILDIDISTAFNDKLAHIKKKYPTRIFNPDRADLETYRKVKQTYRAKKGNA
jgi:NTP pyrophosphatase (non-canonical NTP hydrolase)